MKEIPLTRGKVAIVDDDDYEWLSLHKWHASPDKTGRFRPVRHSGGKLIHMGRQILGEPDGLVDHKDGEPLNNQRSNLRVASHAENSRNRLRGKRGTSRFKGVHFLPKWGTWKAQIKHNGKLHQLGHYKDEETAAAAYRLKAEELHGEFAGLSGLPTRERSLALIAAATKPEKYRGVCQYGNRWRAYVRENGRNIHLGLFATKDAAAEAVAARKAVQHA